MLQINIINNLCEGNCQSRDGFVGFGSDFDGIPDFPAGLKDCSGFKLLKQKLIERGYSRSTMDKISHQNFLRVLEEQ
ncbi:hypothetical protein GF337_07470 [candidate division KSB1 bacterium]|nr:hypothetical protein [candidate division KSB1 bacterium]